MLKESFNYEIPVVIERNVVNFFKYNDNRQLTNIPIYLGTFEEEDKVSSSASQALYFYGFPDLGNGYKFAIHHSLKIFKYHHEIDREIQPQEEQRINKVFSKIFKDFNPNSITITKRETCLYTISPDTNFIVDSLNDDKNLICASPCSGHGFKFVSVIGKYIQEFIDNGRFIEDFGLKRFNPKLTPKL